MAGRLSQVRRFPAEHQRIFAAAQLAVLAVFLVAIGWAVRGSFRAAADDLRHADLPLFGLACLVLAAYYLLFVLGWMRILADWKIGLSYPAALRAEMVSMLAKYVPGGVWTPAARIVAARRAGVTDATLVTASMLLEAGISAVAGVLVFVVSLAWVDGVEAPIVPIVVFAVVVAVLVHPRVFQPLASRVARRLGYAGELPPLRASTVAELLVFYSGTWLVGGAALWLLLRSVGAHPDADVIVYLGGTAAVGAIVAVLSVFAPSGLGPREASMYALMLAVASEGSALGATLLNRVAITVVEVLLLVVGGLLLRGHGELEEEASRSASATRGPSEASARARPPAGEQLLQRRLVELRLAARGASAPRDQLVLAPAAGCDARERGCAERRRLPLGRHLHRDAQHVGEELREEAVRGRAPVHAQHPGPLRHRVEHVARLVGDRLERRADEVLAAGPARDPADEPARVRLPVRRAEAGQRGDEVDAVGRADRAGELLALGRVCEQPEPVAEPLDRRAGDEDRALERVAGLRPGAHRRRRPHEPVRGRRAVAAARGEHERARAECRLRLAPREAGVPVQRRLLVAGERGHRRPHRAEPALAEHLRRAAHPGQQRALDAEEREQLVAPVERPQVEQHRPRGVRDVGRVDGPAGEPPEQPRVHGAEGETIAAAGLREDPLELRRREIRVGREPGDGADLVGRQCSAALGGAPVLPDDRRADRRAGRALPHDGRLALVRDPDRLDVACGGACVGERRRRGRLDARPQRLRVLLDPAGPRRLDRHGHRRAAEHLEAVADDETRRPGRPLVDREDHVAHHRAPGRAGWRTTLAVCVPGSSSRSPLPCSAAPRPAVRPLRQFPPSARTGSPAVGSSRSCPSRRGSGSWTTRPGRCAR